MRHDIDLFLKLQNSYVTTIDLNQKISELRSRMEILYKERLDATQIGKSELVQLLEQKIKKLKMKVDFENRRIRARQKAECDIRKKLKRGYIMFEVDEDFIVKLEGIRKQKCDFDALTADQMQFIALAAKLGYLPYSIV